jgi:hypothetical protein
MQYDVPQFIEEESKIVGPLTLRQFFIFLGAGLFSFMLFFIFEPWLWAGVALLIFIATTFLSFGKIEGRSASTVFLHLIRHHWNPKLYLWKGRELKAEELFRKELGEEKKPARPLKKEVTPPEPMTPEKIKELAKQLDHK